MDDEPDYADLLKDHLERAGFETSVAYSGEEGLNIMRSNAPDLVILDVMMPGMDGYEVCAEVKSDEALAKIPVVMLTAVASHVPSTRYSHYDGITMEADDYLPKPAAPKDVEATVRRFLER